MSLKFSPLALAVSAALLAPAAHAAVLDSVTGYALGSSAGGMSLFVDAANETVVSDLSAFGSIGSDLFLSNVTSPLTLNYRLEAGESDLSFSSVVSFLPNNAGYTGVQLTLGGGATFSLLGSVETTGNLSVPQVSISSDLRTATISLPVSENEVYIGSPFGGLTNWGIGVSGVASSGEFSLTVSAVPEPASVALVLAGLGLCGLARRRAA
jgi:hypothetical protein